MTWRVYTKGLDPDRLAATFIREGRMADKKALRHMRTVSKLVLEQSIRNSPVDKGNLERAHRIEEQYGAGGRLETTVVVDTSTADRMDIYAVWLHESFAWEPGEASKRKIMLSPKNKVGPLFLERALADYDSEFEGGVWRNFVDDLERAMF